jgi:outer membrane protein OmpA-like peptidoglycan-associated protein
MKKTIIYLIFAALLPVCVVGQSRKGDKQYENLSYINAIQTYDRLFSKNISNHEMLQKLGNSYYFNAELLKAGAVYKVLFDGKTEVEPEYYYRYTQCLKAAQNYKLADEMLTKFNQKSGNEQRAKLAVAQKNYLNVIKNNSGKFSVEDAGINSEFSDFGSAFYNNKIVFASARKKPDVNENYAGWTGEKFTDLYSAETDLGGNLSKVALLSSVLNTKYYESTPVFTKDGNTVYYTGNNYSDGKRKFSTEKTTLLKIYKSTFDGKTWSKPLALPFNSDDYQVAHPALSPDEKILYFSSDMPGSVGRSDLYKVSILGDDAYGTPINLGTAINTEGKETFPFVSANNDLYFATDGRPGLGGLDIFKAKLKSEGVGTIINLGMPVNSPFDDFALVINDSNNQGFLSSKRPNGKGNDDIYKVKLVDASAGCEQSISGVVNDANTGNLIFGAKVILFDQSMTQLKEVTSDNSGKFDFGAVDCGSKYYVRTNYTDFITAEIPVLVPSTTGITFVPVVLSKITKPIDLGDDLAKLLEIPIIYFDLDKSFIRADAAVELSKILDVLQQNPNLKIDVRSHTDSRNTAQYNANLSKRRASATVAWLVSKGIDKTRLTSNGFGESRLTNGCTDGVICTEAEHQLNRRSEFIVIKK